MKLFDDGRMQLMLDWKMLHMPSMVVCHLLPVMLRVGMCMQYSN
jgi:hypothetical protein